MLNRKERALALLAGNGLCLLQIADPVLLAWQGAAPATSVPDGMELFVAVAAAGVVAAYLMLASATEDDARAGVGFRLLEYYAVFVFVMNLAMLWAIARNLPTEAPSLEFWH